MVRVRNGKNLLVEVLRLRDVMRFLLDFVLESETKIREEKREKMIYAGRVRR